MKRAYFFGIFMVLALALTTTTAFAESDKNAAIKGQEITATGQITCTFCKLSHPDKVCAKGCCERCIKAGDPPLLTTADGDQYILLTGEHEVPLMSPERYAMLDGTVQVKGVLIQGQGVQAIYVESMEKR
ncbi:MAG: hypothetical protein R2940_00765 [Syntrophotaleaceae bacterium]